MARATGPRRLEIRKARGPCSLERAIDRRAYVERGRGTRAPRGPATIGAAVARGSDLGGDPGVRAVGPRRQAHRHLPVAHRGAVHPPPAQAGHVRDRPAPAAAAAAPARRRDRRLEPPPSELCDDVDRPPRRPHPLRRPTGSRRPVACSPSSSRRTARRTGARYVVSKARGRSRRSGPPDVRERRRDPLVERRRPSTARSYRPPRRDTSDGPTHGATRPRVADHPGPPVRPAARRALGDHRLPDLKGKNHELPRRLAGRRAPQGWGRPGGRPAARRRGKASAQGHDPTRRDTPTVRSCMFVHRPLVRRERRPRRARPGRRPAPPPRQRGLGRRGRVVGDDFQDASAPRSCKTAHGRLRLPAAVELRARMTTRAVRGGRAIARRPLPRDRGPGLIIDLRGNPGGLIWAAERLLQLFTPRSVTPTRFSMVATDLTRAMTDAPQNRRSLSPWRARCSKRSAR